MVEASKSNVSDLISIVFPLASNLKKLLAFPLSRKSPSPFMNIPLLVPATEVFKVAPMANVGVLLPSADNLSLFVPAVWIKISSVLISTEPPSNLK